MTSPAVQIYANNASSTLTGSILNTDLVIPVADGSKFPTPGANQYFLATIEVGTSNEIVKIIGRSGNNLSVDPAGRGMDGTVASPWASGALIEIRTNRATLSGMARYADLLDNYSSSTYDPTVSAFLNKSVLFASSDGRLKQDNANFTYDSGTTTLTSPIAVHGTSVKSPILDSGSATNLLVKTNATTQFQVTHVASAVNWMAFSGATAGNAPGVLATGSDTDIGYTISAKGAGVVQLATAYGFTGIISPAQITSNQNNYSPAGASSANVIRINTDASRNITGFAGGASGRVVTFINIGSFAVVFTNEDTNSTAANRFTLNSASVSVPSGGAISFWYDNTSSRWRGLSAPSSSVDTIQTLTDAATINWDVSLGAWGVVTLAASGHIVGAPTNLVDGKEYVLFVIQDATGSRTLASWNAVFKWPLGIAPTLSTGPSAIDMFCFKSRGGNLYGGMLKGMA